MVSLALSLLEDKTKKFTKTTPLKKGLLFYLVHLARIELVRVAPLDPKSSASASSAIGAFILKEGMCPSKYIIWCRLSESNQQPDDYKSTALPIELRRRMVDAAGLEPTTSSV